MIGTPISPIPRALGYDAKGNLTSGNLDGSGVWAFGYDAENRLLSACKPVVSGTCTSPTVNVRIPGFIAEYNFGNPIGWNSGNAPTGNFRVGTQ